MRNSIIKTLVQLGVCDSASIVEYYPRVRDRDDVKVMRCRKSGVIFLSQSDHIGEDHYRSQMDLSAWSAKERSEALDFCRDDDERRARMFSRFIQGRRWMDVGTGVGGILDLMRGEASEVCAVEFHTGARQMLQSLGYRVLGSLEEARDGHYDVVTMYHVFEHLFDPVQTLRILSHKMVAGGTLIIEVPHARDFLLATLNLESFKKFTFWSEHLILHTRESLARLVCEGGFTEFRITGCQRYPLANHLYWLAAGEPGGHKKWSHLLDVELDRAYAGYLDRIDQTDTLVCIARNGPAGNMQVKDDDHDK